MRGLRKYQELVEGIYTQTSDQFQPDGQAHAAQVVHGLVKRQAARVPQGAVRTPQLVFDNIARVAKQDTARLCLTFDDMAYHAQQLIEQFLFRSAQSRLVGNLEEITHHLAPLT